MALPDDFAADQAEIESDCGTVLTWGGKTYACTLGVLSVRGEVEGLIGPRSGVDQVAFVRVSLFTGSRPVVEETCVVDGVTYRIKGVDTDPEGATLQLSLREEDA